MKKNNSVLIAIDLQKDFMDLSGSSLPVTGAVKDTERLCEFIRKAGLSAIFTSLDSHHTLDISHRAWWKQSNGSFVDPFTLILADDIKNGKYVARIDPKRSLEYVEALERNGEFNHFIWPDHCLIGSEGHMLLPEYMETLRDFEMKNLAWINFIKKGENPFTEHFGIFRANVPMSEDSNTQEDQGMFKTLNDFDTIYLAGQARSHCVANSLRQLLQISPNLANKVVIIEDCMSDVGGLPTDFYTMVDGIYNDAISKGVRTMKSTDI